MIDLFIKIKTGLIYNKVEVKITDYKKNKLADIKSINLCTQLLYKTQLKEC